MTRFLFPPLHRWLAALLLALLAGAAQAVTPDVVAEAEADFDYADAVQALPEANFRVKAEIVGELVRRGHAHARPLIEAMLDNRLYANEAGVFIAEPNADDDADPQWRDALTLQTADATLTSRDRIRTNNSLRAVLKTALAQFDLADPDAAVRLSAVRALSGDLDEDVRALLIVQQAGDDDAAVRREIDIALAVHQLNADDAAMRLAAITVLDGEHRNLVYNRVKPLTDAASEPNPEAARRHRTW